MNKMNFTYIALIAVYVATVFLITVNHFWIGVAVLIGGTALIGALDKKNVMESDKEE